MNYHDIITDKYFSIIKNNTMKDAAILDKNAFNDQQSFETYKTFMSREQAEEYIELLKKHDIQYSAESPELLITSVITGSGMLPKVVLKLHPSDFPNVDALIEQEIMASANVPENYYLRELDNNELQEVLEKPDEWSIQDVTMAKLILRERGINISNEEIQKLRDDRMRELHQGKKAKRSVMLLYFLAVVVFSLLLGLISHWGIMSMLAGLGMGYYYAYDKSTDPDGNKYYTFEPTTRKYGQLILLVGGVVAVMLFSVFFIILA